MIKFLSKIAIVGALTFSLFSGLGVGQGTNQVEAATKLPDNHEIEVLKVEYDENERNYAIHVGDRIGTLLIRVGRPIIKSDSEWQRISSNTSKGIYTIGINMGIYFDQYDNTNFGDIFFVNDENHYNFAEKGKVPNSQHNTEPITWHGMQKFSGWEFPYYYVGNATYIPKKFNKDGIYYFRGGSPFVVDGSQIKAYFYEDKYVVPEAIKNVKTGGLFPLLNKIKWGKTELLKGQLGKVTVTQPTTLWKRLDNGKLEKVRDMKAGEEYRVYRYLEEQGGLYGVGSGMYVQKDTSKVLYETPSKKNLRLLKIMNGEE